MFIVVYEHPTKKAITKVYKAQDFGSCGDLRTQGKLWKEGYKTSTKITIPNEYLKIMENFKKNT